MGELVIAYKAKPGCEAELLKLAVEHVPYLRSLGLVPERAAVAMRGKDGTIIEVFEWRDGAVARAHDMPEIQRLWERYGKVCDFILLETVPEAAGLFATFLPLDV
jgi:hypothetical protein